MIEAFQRFDFKASSELTDSRFSVVQQSFLGLAIELDHLLAPSREKDRAFDHLRDAYYNAMAAVLGYVQSDPVPTYNFSDVANG